MSLSIECDFWVDRVILSDFRIFRCLPVRKNRRLHTAETTVNLTKPPLFSTRARIEGRTTYPFHRNDEMSRFCLSNPTEAFIHKCSLLHAAVFSVAPQLSYTFHPFVFEEPITFDLLSKGNQSSIGGFCKQGKFLQKIQVSHV